VCSTRSLGEALSLETQLEFSVRSFALASLALSDLVVALVYNGVNSSIDAARGKHDTLNSISAGAITGVLYKSTGMSSRPIFMRNSFERLSISRC